MNKYPEHNRLKAVKERSQAIGEFIAWLRDEQGVSFLDCEGDYHRMSSMPIEKMLAEFFDIDLDKIENEKRAMIDELRATRTP